MRKTGARAAAVLLALALVAIVAPGCDWVSSLTPFGVGTRNYGAETQNVNGLWVGKTGSGGDIGFQVGNDAVSRLLFTHLAPECIISFDAQNITEPVVDNVFTFELILDQGRVVATGNFTTATSCSGTYFFEALPAGVCPTSGTGTFSAEKTTP